MQFPTLLSDLPATFDKSPDLYVVWQIGHPDGITWTVTSDNRLIVSVGDKDAVEYALIGRTIPELGTLLAADFSIQTLYIHPDATTSGAAILHPSSGATPDGRAASLNAYRNPLRTHLATIASALDEAESAGNAAIGQLILPDSNGIWTDYWGNYFGVSRGQDETDADYAQRIIDEVFRARSNNRAIENNIDRYCGYTVDIKEPWRYMFTLGRSKLDDFDIGFPGLYHRYHVIHPIARETVDWAVAMPVVEADRPAGTLVWPPSYRPPGQMIDIGGENGWQVDTAYSKLKQSRARLAPSVLDVDLGLGVSLPAQAPKSLCGRFVAAEIDPLLPTGTLSTSMAREIYSAAIVFVDYPLEGWTGGWDGMTWVERSGKSAVPAQSQHTSLA